MLDLYLKKDLVVNYRYILEQELGRGSYGQVWKAEDRVNGDEVAIKFLENVEDEEILELEMYHQLKGHPHIVCIKNSGEMITQNTRIFYIVMEMAETDLRKKIGIMNSSKPMELQEAVDCIKQILKGLVWAEEKRIRHMDIKPSNILVCGNMYKIGDFGSARIAKRLVTYTQKHLNILPYVPPEGLSDTRVSANYDVYSLGIIFYELLTGILPYKDMQAVLGFSPVKAYEAKMKNDYYPLSYWKVKVPDELWPLLLKSITGDDKKRFPSPLAFLQALEEIQPVSIHFQEDVSLSDIGLRMVEIRGFWREGRIKRALQLTEETMKELGEQEDLLLLKAELLIDLGEMQDAIKQLHVVLNKTKTKIKQVYQRIGDCYVKLIQYREAFNYYRKVLQIDPKDLYSLYRAGICGVLLEETKEAEGYFLQGLEIQPNNWVILKRLAHVYEIKEDISSAMTYYQQILSLNQGDHDVMFRLFKMARMSKDDKLAKELAGSLYKESTDPDVLSIVKEFLQRKEHPTRTCTHK